MDCEIDLSSGEDYEPIEGLELNQETAPGPWECGECGREFAGDVVHEHATGECDGQAFDERTCNDCVAIAKAFGDGSRVFGTLWEEFESNEFSDEALFAKFNTGCLGKIESSSARAYIVERWQKWKGLSK
jgi:hypothetical protein